MGVDLEAEFGSAHVDADDHALGAERVANLADQLWTRNGGAIDTDLVRAYPQQAAGVGQRPHAPADGEGDEHLFRRAGHHLDHGPAALRGGGDVVEHQLVGALSVVAGCQLHRVTGVAQIEEVDAFHHSPGVDIQTRDDPDRPQRTDLTRTDLKRNDPTRTDLTRNDLTRRPWTHRPRPPRPRQTCPRRWLCPR